MSLRAKQVLTLGLIAGLAVLYSAQSGWTAGEARVGNEPLSEANYEPWPGIVKTVNDKSRVHYWWVNGNERFSYSGTTEDLNRVLASFAETELEELQVALLPGPARTVDTMNTKAENVDWDLALFGGIALGYVKHHKLEAAFDLVPTLTIYVSDRLELSELKIPAKLQLLQVSDYRKKYREACLSENELLQKTGQQNWVEFEKRISPDPDSYNQFLLDVIEIEKFIKEHQAKAEKALKLSIFLSALKSEGC